jgi:DNA polymerase I
MPEKPKLYLIDGTAYIHRGYHAIRNLANSKGFPTNAVFSFTRMLIKFMNERQPDYAAVAFDSKGPTFRHDISDQYKANRPPMPDDMAVQIPYIKKIVTGFNLAMLEEPGYEADDIIGTLAVQAADKGFLVVIVSGDKDFAQLVADEIIIWDPMKEKQVDTAAILEKYGVQPDQMLDVMSLAGDSADNIKGVPGIGEKTALSLIKTFGSLDALYDQVDTITKKKQRENLIQYKDLAYLSRKLAAIDTAMALEWTAAEFSVPEADKTVLSDLFGELEFSALQKELTQQSDLAEKKYVCVNDTAGLKDLLSLLEKADAFAFDTETTSLDPMTAELVGLSFSVAPDQAFYIPCGHTCDGVPVQLPVSDILDQVQIFFNDPKKLKVAQNIKYDWTILSRYGLTIAGPVFDTMIAAYLLNPSRRGYGLDQIALDLLGHKMISYQEVTQKKGGKEIPFSEVPLADAVPYACEDADITFSAYQLLSPKLEAAGLLNLFETIEMPLVPVLMDMEKHGVTVDQDALRDLSKTLEHQLEQLETEIYALAGETFNINSPQQLGHILFDKLGLPVQKKTKKKTGYSTDIDVLSALSEQHELPALIIQNRTLAKLKSTYADALLKMINPETGRVHTSYNQTATATGRLSSTDPNLQNIPIRTEEGRRIRQAFIPRPGWAFISADYSQIELRLLAHYSADPILIDAFEKDEDIHTRTAGEVFQVFPELITDDLRRQAKAINFGIVYGMSPFGLSKELGISQKMAKNYIDGYFSRYSGVKKFIDKTIETAHQTRQTRTLLGRIRHLPDIASSNSNVRKFAERAAINTPIQGTAADIIKLAMIETAKALDKQNLSAAMLLSVHDEIVLECPPEETEDVIAMVKTTMETVYPLVVPLKVDLAQGHNWAEAH